MKIDLEFVELETPLFLGGVNFGTKLHDEPTKNAKGRVTMWYDTDLRHTFVVFNDKLAIIESTASKTVKNPAQLGVELKPTTKTTTGRLTAPSSTTPVKAQVSGPGMGIKVSAQISDPTRQAPKTITRKAKYQGEESQGE